MFLRSRGRKILLLQSYRDSRGLVRQRCLGSARDQQGLEEVLRGLDIALSPNLRSRALELFAELEERRDEGRRQERLARRARALLRSLVRQEVERLELRQLQQHFGSPLAKPNISLKERMRHDCREATGRALAQFEQGRLQECLREFDGLPLSHPWGHLNRAALHWRQGQAKQALDSVLQGLAKDPEILRELEGHQKGFRSDYWDAYGHLWGDTGREFLLRLGKQTYVKIQTSRVREGLRLRRLIKERSQGWLLERVVPTAT